jgi:hypothetical protein
MKQYLKNNLITVIGIIIGVAGSFFELTLSIVNEVPVPESSGRLTYTQYLL